MQGLGFRFRCSSFMMRFAHSAWPRDTPLRADPRADNADTEINEKEEVGASRGCSACRVLQACIFTI